ncbi:hypothetical protein, variant [Aphanomyces astaci]|uniref:Uncharacterized protein n=1 Tax=Aphanomyces astaci TaxID=112090 RepID=W4FGV9_APHAT|nr:hypothetical protein, variant [Aphanomyces astaci]ETV66046.1 hypothetical protein, variant [Aphanomyces astaci]|eukprot:XP_009844474.1 hypothetical protein, variant [Aphanomyces astaci]
MATRRFDVAGNFIEPSIGDDATTSGDLRAPYEIARLPTMEMMLSVPPEFIVRHVHLGAEAELLLHIGDLGAKLDNVLEVTLEQASDYARCHSILKASVQSSMSNGLYVSESVTRHHAALGIDATNLTLLDSHVHAVLDQLAAEQNKLRRFLATNRMFVHELEASGESAALLKSKAQIVQVEELLAMRVQSILTSHMPLSVWNPLEMWPDFVYSRYYP